MFVWLVFNMVNVSMVVVVVYGCICELWFVWLLYYGCYLVFVVVCLVLVYACYGRLIWWFDG